MFSWSLNSTKSLIAPSLLFQLPFPLIFYSKHFMDIETSV
jgi:hypothetical protein